MITKDETIKALVEKNKTYQQNNKNDFATHVKGQSPKIAVLTCADSRVVPEFIFNAGIGELFVVRVAGNIAVDQTVIASIDYAVDHLQVTHLIILAHSHCGAVKAAEETKDGENLLLSEIQQCFSIDKDHIRANLLRQLKLLPKRSSIVKKAINTGSLKLVGAMYHLNDGHVEFLTD